MFNKHTTNQDVDGKKGQGEPPPPPPWFRMELVEAGAGHPAPGEHSDSQALGAAPRPTPKQQDLGPSASPIEAGPWAAGFALPRRSFPVPERQDDIRADAPWAPVLNKC